MESQYVREVLAKTLKLVHGCDGIVYLLIDYSARFWYWLGVPSCRRKLSCLDDYRVWNRLASSSTHSHVIMSTNVRQAQNES